jgi:transcriptional regulator GlxA family with amidase domain
VPLCGRAHERSAPFLSLTNPLAKARNDGRLRDLGTSASKRRRRVVLHPQLDLFCLRLPDQPRRDVKTEIDPGCHPTAGDEIAVNDDPSIVGYRAELAQQFARGPMAARTPAREQSRGSEQKRPGAYGGHQTRSPGDGPDRIEHEFVAEQLECARPARDAEHIERRAFLETRIGPQLQSPFGTNGLCVFPEQMHRCARRPGKHLVRSSEIELRDAGKNDEAYPMVDGHCSARANVLRRMRAIRGPAPAFDTKLGLAERTNKAHILPTSMRRSEVLILAYDGAQPIDIAGPLQALATANEEAGREAYRVRVAALRGAALHLAGGLRVLAEKPPRRIDTLLLPGGPGVHAARRDPSQVAAVRKLARRARRVCSVCTGAFLLAEAGLLKDRKAVTHWRSCARLADEYPNVRVLADPIWVRDGQIWTSAGVTAGIDLTLALIEEDLGAPVALQVARRLVVYMRRPGGQAQHSAPLALQSADAFGPLMDWIVANLHKTLTVEQLADQSGMAARSFHRHFLARTRMTPAKAVERLRLDQARTLIETTKLSLGTIAARVGFGSEERLRRSFYRALRVAPNQYRQRFQTIDH